MISEVASILTGMGGVVTAVVQSRRKPASLRNLLFVSIIACLSNFVTLSISGALRNGDDFLGALHAATGHLMLPLAAFASGLWLGSSFFGNWRLLRVIPRLFYLLILCFFCLSNTWTGYFGPSRIDPSVDPETNLRFVVLHQWTVPLLIGTMLLFWFRRLAAKQNGTGLRKPR